MTPEEFLVRRMLVHKVAKRLRVAPPSDSEIKGQALPLSGESLYGCIELWLVKRGTPLCPRTPRLPNDGWVYFVRGADKIKIGTTGSVARRLATLRCASPVELTLLHSMPGSQRVERHLHRQFADLRMHGEWFRAEEPLLSHIARLRERAQRKAA